MGYQDLLAIILKMAMGSVGNRSRADANPIELVRKYVRDEVSAIGYRFLMGIVLVAVILVAVVQLGSALKIYLDQVQNGYVLEIGSFGLMAVAGSVGLYFLFHKGSRKHGTKKRIDENPPSGLDPKRVALQFLEGFLKGLDKNKDHGEPKP